MSLKIQIAVNHLMWQTYQFELPSYVSFFGYENEKKNNSLHCIIYVWIDEYREWSGVENNGADCNIDHTM